MKKIIELLDTIACGVSKAPDAEEIRQAIAILREHYKPEPPKRWRAGLGEEYEYVSTYGNVCRWAEDRQGADDALYALGNYYQPGTGEAQAAAERVRRAYLNEPDPRVEGLLEALREIAHSDEVNLLWWAHLASTALREWEGGGDE